MTNSEQTPPPEELLTLPVLAHHLERSTGTVRSALLAGRIRPDALGFSTPGRQPMPLFKRNRLPELTAQIIARN